MAFDINQKVFDRNGEHLEKKSIQYREQLTELFEESPEGKALQDEGIEPGWASMMLDFGVDYLALTPPQMSPDDLREILFDLIPRKVSAEADEAPAIIRELQAFWKFLQREFHLENAAACLKVLDDKAARELKKEMSNPANYGMAKSFVMMGKERGFDMTSEEGINEWMLKYNAELAAGTGQRVPLPAPLQGLEAGPPPSPPSMPAFPSVWPQSARKVQGTGRRKMANQSRKRNRKRK